ncbi:MAG: efflux RND transporter periplasmic adaptor subunit [Saprospiraceae bacterium]|jgi:membrane fusion protein (multidrug efflux system)|nr:efflux RND transporter periplasmic adaptor subunit [Saprospiraceae bacterium]MBK7699567.1 efflux RND transporter periplasmic adaptor subunit [Saprospiraceae bacterium]MBK8825670.1 efflux RND transporter periplasmic adaptor subunit [Saprospiraceae bacterium]MBK9582820.1 efflux RND transporter periplasmic adaptor subunit [Saprospiraceae bacterium]MBK9744096.1 efflux RND transporter periplasmic adaptor subunit [Saprospiraceae bacterium]
MKTKIILFILTIFWISCGKQVEVNAGLDAKLKELETLKQQHAAISAKMDSVQAEIIRLDPSRGIRPKLVTTATITPEGFNHYIDLQGTVSSTNTSYVAPRNGMGGYVKQVYVKAGQSVKKGQLLLKLDDQVLRQGIETTRTQLALAKNVYDRTKNLWDQNIGTEVQLLSAKTNMETLENQIKLQEEQLKTYLVYADQNGIADIVNIKVGELFTGMSAAGPQIQIVNNSKLSVNIEIPENYTGKIKQGATVMVEIPAVGKTFKASIDRLSQSINPSSRGFTAECNIPATAGVKPNMSAYTKILNHSNSKAMVIPVNIIQSDEKGKYVYVLVSKDGKNIAAKKSVVIGQLYDDNIEILNGLNAGDAVIIQGYQNLYEGQVVENQQ